MRLVHKLSKRTTVEADGDSIKDLFKAISAAGEVFSVTTCGNCQSEDVAYRVRHVEGNDFFEVVCRGCNHTFSFGQHRTGNSLFPKTRDADGRPLPKGGWSRYVPEKS